MGDNHQNGFIAIVSAVVISALLILITLDLSYAGVFVRVNVLDTEYKKESVGYAEACVEKARIMIANTNGFSASNQGVDIDPALAGNECTLNVSGTAPYVIHAQAV